MRLLVVTGILTASSALAYAQAPGDFYSDGGDSSTSAPGETAPSEEPPVVPPAPTSPPATYCGRGQRFSLGFNIGGMSVAPQGYSNGEPTDFNITELAFRYRPWAHLEFEFSLGGGRQQLSDGSKGNLAMGNGQLDLRYRFSPHAAWNWWVMAGVGQTMIAAHDSTKAELDAAKEKHSVVGIGIERRFRHFAIDSELRYVSIDGHDTPVDGVTNGGMGGSSQPAKTPGGNGMPAPDGNLYTPVSQKLVGGQFVIGLSYYF